MIPLVAGLGIVLAFQSHGRRVPPPSTLALFRKLSRLRPMPSDLASACFLIQGFPENVVGVDFAYSNEASIETENDVDALLTKRRGPKALANALRDLSRRTFVFEDGRVALDLDGKVRTADLRSLRSGLGGTEWTRREKRLATVLACYYGDHGPKETERALASLARFKDPTAALYARNLRAISKRLTDRRSRPGGERPYPVR